MRKVQGNRDQMKGMLVVVSAQSKKLCHHGKCSSQVDGLTVGEIQRVVESQRLVSMAAEQQDRCGCLVLLIVK